MLIGVRPSSVPLTKSAGMSDRSGARKSSPRRGMPSTSQMHGKGKSIAAPSTVAADSRRIRSSRGPVPHDAQSMHRLMGKIGPTRRRPTTVLASWKKSPCDIA